MVVKIIYVNRPLFGHPLGHKKILQGIESLQDLSGWADLNRRPRVPQTRTLNPCATTRKCIGYPTGSNNIIEGF